MPESERLQRYLLILAIAVGLIALLDAATGLTTPGRSWRLAAGGIGLAAAALWARVQPRGRLLALLLVPALVAPWIGAWSTVVLSHAAADPAHDREGLDRRADRLAREFDQLLARLAEPAAMLEARPFSGAYSSELRPTAELFELTAMLRDATRLDSERLGVSLVDSAGNPVAWSGHTTPLSPTTLHTLYSRTEDVLVADSQIATRIFRLSSVGESGNALVVEYLLRSRVEQVALGDLLPSLPPEAGRSRVQFQDQYRGAAEMEELFARHADRYWGGDEGQTLIFPLRGPGDRILAVVTLRAPRRDLDLAEMRRRSAGIAAGLCAATFLGLLAFGWCRWAARLRQGALRRGAVPWFVALSTCLWLARIVAARGGFPQGIWEIPAYSFERFGSAVLGGLLASPADLFLTGATVVAQALLVGLLLRGLLGAPPEAGAPARPGRTTLLAAAILLLGYGVGWAFGRLAHHVAVHGNVNFLDVHASDLTVERLLLQAGLLAVLLAGLLIVGHAIAVAGPFAGWSAARRPAVSGLPGGFRYPNSLLPGIALATAVFYPILFHAHGEAVRRFYEDSLMPQVLGQRALREEALRSSMALLAEHVGLAEALAASDTADLTTLAFDLWIQTPLAEEGLDSGLRIFDRRRKIVSGFALNVPVEGGLLPTKNGYLPSRGLQRDIWFDGRPVGRVVLEVRDDFFNLPFLTSQDPYVELLRAGQPRPPEEIAGRQIHLFVYDLDGEPLASTDTLAPPLPADIGMPLQPGEWRRVRAPSGADLDLLFSRGPDELFALGHPSGVALERVGGFIRTLLLHLGGALAVMIAGALVTALREPRRLRPAVLIDWLGRSYFRKLLASFVVASLVPLLGLAFFLEGFISRAVRQEILEQDRERLQVARRILQELAAGNTPDLLTDRTLGELRGVVGHDLHLYAEDRLLLTSRRVLVSSGMLSAQLDGATYRALYLSGMAFSEQPQTVGGLEYTLLAAPLALQGLGERNALTLPVVLRSARVEDRVARAGDAILIATLLMVLLLAATGLLVARLLSRPIERMVAATVRLARGDLDTRVEVHTGDETASLVASFNEMSRALQEREGQLRRNLLYIGKVLDNVTTGVVSLDAAGAVVTINPAARRLLTADDLPAGTDLQAFLEERAALRDLREASRAAWATGGVHRTEISVHAGAEEEEPRRLRVVFLPFPLEEGAGRILLLEDITDVVRSNRLEAWAEMARRIAHEIKNPLTPIRLSADHLRNVHARWRREGGAADGPYEASFQECVAIIEDQVSKLRQIAREFSDYARIPAIRKTPTDPAALLGDVLQPYAAVLPDSIRLEQAVEPGLPRVSVDPGLLRRTLVNLVENSLQAMPEGGRLRVTAGILARNGHPCLEITVADDGVGISPEGLERLFEPYFSTKEGGTGLGLAIARKAVEEHGGELRAESREGEGTTFRIWIPLGTTGEL